jgi:hypothetical protein
VETALLSTPNRATVISSPLKSDPSFAEVKMGTAGCGNGDPNAVTGEVYPSLT